jgi:sulfatase maturation enzyme AslB (radical SAM superfamily)
MAGMKDFYLGNIHDSSPKPLKDSVFVTEPCTSCEILPICGGRCLYANATNLWGTEGFKQVCGTVVNLIEGLQEAKPEIQSLIKNGTVHREDFTYQKYNGCEIIP